MKQILFIFLIILAYSGCSFKTPQIAKSATIIFKTPKMKFYDKGFINKFDEYINLQVYNAGSIVLNLNIYKDVICKSSIECTSSKEFNKNFLDEGYENSFLYDLLRKELINFKDNENNILIKVKYDKM